MRDRVGVGAKWKEKNQRNIRGGESAGVCPLLNIDVFRYCSVMLSDIQIRIFSNIFV